MPKRLNSVSCLSMITYRVRLLNATDEYRNIMSDVHALGHFLNFVKKLPNATPMEAEQDMRKMCRCYVSPSLGVYAFSRIIVTYIYQRLYFS